MGEEIPALVKAVQDGDVDRVRALLAEPESRELLRKPENLDTSRDWYYPVVMSVCQGRHTEIMTLLVEHGADPNAASGEGRTALINAVGRGDSALVQCLLDLGANINQNGRAGTALHEACVWEKPGMVELLLRNGADINAVNKEGHTPMFTAIDYENDRIVRLLLLQGALLDGQAFVQQAYDEAVRKVQRAEAVLAEVAQEAA